MWESPKGTAAWLQAVQVATVQGRKGRAPSQCCPWQGCAPSLHLPACNDSGGCQDPGATPCTSHRERNPMNPQRKNPTKEEPFRQ